MKKIAIVLALIASLQVAGAQPKSLPAAKSAVDAAAAAAANQESRQGSDLAQTRPGLYGSL